MCIVVESQQELYSLLVDGVGDVITVSEEGLKKNPNNLSQLWKEISVGILPQTDQLVVILDIEKVILALKE